MRRTVRIRRGRRPGGFTLVELLVVVLIVVLVSAVALPVVLPAITHRQLSEAARVLQAEIVNARDRAIRAGHACGIRLLPDPAFVNQNNLTSNILAYNRIVPLELAPDYSLGHVSIKSLHYGDMNGVFGGADTSKGVTASGVGILNPPFTDPNPNHLFMALYPSAYPSELDDVQAMNPDPYPDPYSKLFQGAALMIEAEPIQGGTGWIPTTPASNQPGVLSQVPNEPVNWWWNIRVGDQLQLNGEGNTYTVVGPILIHPTNPSTPGQNPELFVNVGPPGNYNGTPYDSPLIRVYGSNSSSDTQNKYPMSCQFLYLVNGQDDNLDGYVDNGWDNLDNDLNGIKDGLFEWETESWVGTLGSKKRGGASNLLDMPYTITRRPVPAADGRVTTLPSNVVIDATTSLQMTFPGPPITTVQPTYERSRLPVDPSSYYVDIMILPGGQVLPTTQFSTPASFPMGTGAFFHFWLTERLGIVEPASSTLVTGGNTLLPMPAGSANYPSTAPALQGDRILITLFTKTGQVVSNSIETFNGINTNIPFQAAQLGVGEAK